MADGHAVGSIKRHITMRAVNFAQLPPGEPANVLGVECSSANIAQGQDALRPLNEFPVQCCYVVQYQNALLYDVAIAWQVQQREYLVLFGIAMRRSRNDGQRDKRDNDPVLYRRLVNFAVIREE